MFGVGLDYAVKEYIGDYKDINIKDDKNIIYNYNANQLNKLLKDEEIEKLSNMVLKTFIYNTLSKSFAKGFLYGLLYTYLYLPGKADNMITREL